jgi:hypothetical protein
LAAGETSYGSHSPTMPNGGRLWGRKCFVHEFIIISYFFRITHLIILK